MKAHKNLLIILFALSSLTACSSFLEAMGSYYENGGYQPYGVYGYNCGHNHYNNTYNYSQTGYNTQAGYSIPSYLDPQIFAQNAKSQINAQVNAEMEAKKNLFLNQYRNNYKMVVGREPTAEEEEIKAYTQYLEGVNAAYNSNQSSSSYDNTGKTTRKTIDYKQRTKDFLNSHVGEYCSVCKGTGKCRACNGTKIASGYGVTYKCTSCPENGICDVCDGTGKASWNR